jgi:hypothetical protein
LVPDRSTTSHQTKINIKNADPKLDDTKVFLEFLVAEGERRKIEKISPNELKNLAKRFVL